MASETTIGKVLRWSAFGLLAFFGLMGSLFVVGETMSDPGGPRGVLMVAVWLVPMVVACVVCALWPRVGTWVAGVAIALIAVLWAWNAADPQWWQSFSDDHGPVLAVATFALGLPLAFLGLREPKPAGLMLLVAAAVPILGALVAADDAGGRPAGSAILVVVPFAVCGALFLIAGLMRGRGAPRSADSAPQIPAGSAP